MPTFSLILMLPCFRHIYYCHAMLIIDYIIDTPLRQIIFAITLRLRHWYFRHQILAPLLRFSIPAFASPLIYCHALIFAAAIDRCRHWLHYAITFSDGWYFFASDLELTPLAEHDSCHWLIAFIDAFEPLDYWFTISWLRHYFAIMSHISTFRQIIDNWLPIFIHTQASHIISYFRWPLMIAFRHITDAFHAIDTPFAAISAPLLMILLADDIDTEIDDYHFDRYWYFLIRIDNTETITEGI